MKIWRLLIFVRSLLLSEGNLQLSKMLIFQSFSEVDAPDGSVFLHKYKENYIFIQVRQMQFFLPIYHAHAY